MTWHLLVDGVGDRDPTVRAASCDAPGPQTRRMLAASGSIEALCAPPGWGVCWLAARAFDSVYLGIVGWVLSARKELRSCSRLQSHRPRRPFALRLWVALCHGGTAVLGLRPEEEAEADSKPQDGEAPLPRIFCGCMSRILRAMRVLHYLAHRKQMKWLKQRGKHLLGAQAQVPTRSDGCLEVQTMLGCVLHSLNKTLLSFRHPPLQSVE